MYLDLYILESILRPVRLPAWFLLGGALDLAQDLGAVLGSPKYNIMYRYIHMPFFSTLDGAPVEFGMVTWISSMGVARW